MASSIFCDTLSYTVPPDRLSLVDDVEKLAAYAGASLDASVAPVRLWRFDRGHVRITRNNSFIAVYASGGACEVFRLQSLWLDYLSIPAEGPHRVTRLDAARDELIDTPDVIAALRAKFPSGKCRLSHKPVGTKCLLSVRGDGRETGTFYVGDRGKSEVIAAVYDKQHESKVRRNEDIPPTTRTEMRFSKGVGPTLRDAAEPERIFWHYASPALLERPEGVPEWQKGWGEGWTMARVERLPAEILRRRVETSGDLAAMLKIAEDMGPHGVSFLRQLLEQRIESHSSAAFSSEAG